MTRPPARAYPEVVIPVVTQHYAMVQRNLLYGSGRPSEVEGRVTGSVMAYRRRNDMILLGCVGVSADGQ